MKTTNLQHLVQWLIVSQSLPLIKWYFTTVNKISIRSLRSGVFDKNYLIFLAKYYSTCFSFEKDCFLLCEKDPLMICPKLYLTSLLCRMSIYVLANIAR